MQLSWHPSYGQPLAEPGDVFGRYWISTLVKTWNLLIRYSLMTRREMCTIWSPTMKGS